MGSLNKITEGLYMLRELIPNWNISEQTVKVWALALRDLSDEQITFAFEAYITNSTSEFNRIPRPGDLRKLVEVATKITWDQAFEEIQGKAYKCISPDYIGGQFMPVNWSSESVRDAMYRMGGPEFFVSMANHEVNTARAQFRQVWEGMEQKATISNQHPLIAPKTKQTAPIPQFRRPPPPPARLV